MSLSEDVGLRETVFAALAGLGGAKYDLAESEIPADTARDPLTTLTLTLTLSLRLSLRLSLAVALTLTGDAPGGDERVEADPQAPLRSGARHPGRQVVSRRVK